MAICCQAIGRARPKGGMGDDLQEGKPRDTDEGVVREAPMRGGIGSKK